ncbi:KY [Branchiostoma lanceolatum]|uniref:KY protein n=1 Tax=Branchiostoma lanceolatum TaxID=7740 RepID=A0A8K0A408_BRALA|nr:KY [Branchiostoma lanceolatum]
MCSLAGLQHKTVRGYAKSVKFYPGTKLGSSFRGSWPQVLIDGRWGIIDSAWGSHHVIDDLDKTAKDLQTVYAFDEFHFLPNPRHYLSAHHPDDERHQFLQSPAPVADFEPHVKCGPYFFIHQLKLLSHHHGLVPTENGQARIYIGFNPEDYSTIKFSFRMQTMDRQSMYKDNKLDQYVWQERKRDAVIFTIQPPEKGRFLLDIFSGVRGGNGTKYTCEYAIDCEKAMPEEQNKPLPDWQGAWGPGVNVMNKGLVPLSHPTHVVDCPEGRAAVQFSVPEQLDFYTFFFEKTTEEEHLNRYIAHEVVDGVATFNVINPSRGNLGLAIYAKGKEDKGKTLPHLCHYLTSTDSPSEEVPFPNVANGRFGPCLPEFLDIGMSTRSHSSAFIECDTGDLHISIGTTKRPIITYTLTWETLEEKVKMNNYSLHEMATYPDGSAHSIGRYFLHKCSTYCEDLGWEQSNQLSDAQLLSTSGSFGFVEVEEDLEIVLDSTKSLEFLHDFKFWTAEEKEEGLDDFCCHKVLNEGKRTAVLVRFPNEGEYVLQLYAKEMEIDSQYGSVANYLILCKKSVTGCTAFPNVWSRRWGPLYPDFSSMGLSLASHTDPMIHSRTGALKISLGRSKPLQFLCRLYHCENGQQTDLPNHVFIKDDLGEEGKMTARLLMPHTGDYKLQISVKEAKVKKTYLTAINYLIHCSNAVHGSLEFPESFSNWGPGCQVYEPQMRALPAGKETHFKVTIPDAVDVAVISPDGKWSHLTKQEDGTWENDVTVSGEDFVGKIIKLSAKMNDGKNTYWAILQYVVGEEFLPVPIIWEGDAVGGEQDVSRTEEEPKPSTGEEQEDSRDEEEPKDEDELKSPADREQDNSRDAEQPKFSSNGNDEPRADEESKPATDVEQNESRDEEADTKPATEVEENESRNEENSKPSKDVEQGDLRDEEETKTLTDGELDASTNDETETPADGEQDKDDPEPSSSTDEDDHSAEEEEPEPSTDEEDDPKDEEEPIDGQEEAYKVVLRQHQATIEAEMSPEEVIPRLEQEGFVDDEKARELLLMVPENLPEVNRHILTASTVFHLNVVVQREGEGAFVTLRDVMKETGQSKIMDVIQDVVIVVPDNKLDKLQKKLAEATQAKNKGRLEKIMAECREHGMDEDDDVLKEAQRTLDLIEARQGLIKAIQTRHRDQINAALEAAQPFKRELRKHMKEAKEVLDKIKRLTKLRHAIMEMKQTTVAEIKTYNNPPPAVHNVMMATFLLLGNTMAQVNDWVSLLALIGKTGKQSLKRRVQDCEPAYISPDTAAEAKQCLGDLSLDGVRDQSSGAATFYVWTVGTINEVEEMALNKQRENTKAL